MPLQSQIHTDKLLGNIAVKYRPPEHSAMSLFPTLSVKKDSDLYRIYTRNFRIPDTERSVRGVANERVFDVTTSSYRLKYHGLKDYISNEDKQNYDMFDLRKDTTEELTDAILQRLELTVSELFTTTGWSQNVSLAAANAFNANTTVSDPVPVFDTGATTVIQNSGKMPNKGVLARDAFIAVKNHVSILDRVKYTQSKVTKDLIKGLLDLEELVTPVASYDTSAEGQTESISQMWGDSAWLGWTPPSVSRDRPSAGVIFRKNMPMVRRWTVEDRGPTGSEAIEVNMAFDAKIVASLCGYLIKDVV